MTSQSVRGPGSNQHADKPPLPPTAPTSAARPQVAGLGDPLGGFADPADDGRDVTWTGGTRDVPGAAEAAYAPASIDGADGLVVNTGYDTICKGDGYGPDEYLDGDANLYVTPSGTAGQWRVQALLASSRSASYGGMTGTASTTAVVDEAFTASGGHDTIATEAHRTFVARTDRGFTADEWEADFG